MKRGRLISTATTLWPVDRVGESTMACSKEHDDLGVTGAEANLVP